MKDMDDVYCCDVKYKIINLRDHFPCPEDEMNKLAAQGYRVHSHNQNFIIMVKESYYKKPKSKSKSEINYDLLFCDEGRFYGFKVVVNERTSQYCKGSIYIPNYTYNYKEIEQITGSFAIYLADKYHVRTQVIARRNDNSELNLCCIEAFPEEKMHKKGEI